MTTDDRHTDGPPPDAPPAVTDADAERARRMHERTGEIELLISGALLIALVQVPGRLNGLFDAILPRLAEGQQMPAFLALFYINLIVLTLIVSFGLHLVTRAYWVGLVGLDSVFPEGIDWDRIRYGPGVKRAYRKRLPTIPLLARRADNFGSSIFSFAFMVIALFVVSIVIAGIVGLILLGAHRLFPGLPGWAPLAVLLVVVLLPQVAIVADKVMGDRIDPDSRAGRWVERSTGWAYRLAAGPMILPIQFVLFSRVPKRVIWPLWITIFIALFVGISGTQLWRAGRYALSPSDLFPTRAGPRAVSTDAFADTRSESGLTPFIQSDIVEDPYVRLTVPIVASRVLDRLGTVCPDLTPGGEAGIISSSRRSDPEQEAYERELLRCLGQIWTIRLDANEIPVAWDLVWTSGQGVTAIVAYLDAEAMSKGAHLLEVSEMPSQVAEGEDPPEDPPQPAVEFIRFRR